MTFYSQNSYFSVYSNLQKNPEKKEGVSGKIVSKLRWATLNYQNSILCQNEIIGGTGGGYFWMDRVGENPKP